MTTAVLSVLEPVNITSDMLVSSTVPETVLLWDQTKTYAAGELCRSPTTNHVYASGKDGNLNHDPALLENQAGAPAWWVDKKSSNRWLMFDNQVNTQTVASSPLEVVLRPGPCRDLYLAGMDADAVSISVKDKTGGTVIFEMTQELEASRPGDYDEYFWGGFIPMTELLVNGVDPYYKCEVTVRLTKVTGPVKCGLLAFGEMIPLGQTLADAQVSPRTYSYIDTDSFGNTEIQKRPNVTDMEVTAVLERSEARTVLAAIQRLQAVPCVWSASANPEYAGLRGFGLGSGTITYNGSDRCTLRFTMQGLI
jgi:hypothetical protein